MQYTVVTNRCGLLQRIVALTPTPSYHTITHMLIDLHTHSVASDDSRATVEQYVKWVGVLRRKGFNIDGFVLTEHRGFDFEVDYSSLAHENDLKILKGAELDTNNGHFLVYGVSEELTKCINFANINMDAAELVEAADARGGIAIPAHPGRFGIGFYEFIGSSGNFRKVRVIEYLNGGNRPGEQERTEELIKRYGYAGTGGSDAHLVSAIGTCMTQFDSDVFNEQDLVRELKDGHFRAIRLADSRVAHD